MCVSVLMQSKIQEHMIANTDMHESSQTVYTDNCTHTQTHICWKETFTYTFVSLLNPNIDNLSL